MKRFLTCIVCSFAGLVHASQCSMGSITDSKMYLAGYYHSQAATAFNIRCDRAYNITFSSANLQDVNGLSFVSNGAYRLRTRLTVSGPVENKWNVPLTARSTGMDKYVIAVHLEDRPSIQVPAGIYQDTVYVNLAF